MVESAEAEDWIEVGAALDEYFQHLRLPHEVLGDLRGRSVPSEPGTIWLSDHALYVQRVESRLVVARSDFLAILQKVRPLSASDV